MWVFNHFHATYPDASQNIVDFVVPVVNQTIQISQRILSNIDQLNVRLSCDIPSFMAPNPPAFPTVRHLEYLDIHLALLILATGVTIRTH
jgi:hypothetical protein